MAYACTGRAMATARATRRISRISGPSTTRVIVGSDSRVVRSRISCIASSPGYVDLQLEEEPIELRLGKRIRAFHLDRILRRHDEERLLERIRRLADRHADVLHRLQQRRLRFRRRTVDLVGQHDVGEDRPRLELEERAAVRVLLHDVGADDVGRHQVGRELDARELEVQRVGEGVHEARLADARNAFEQHVPAGKQARHRSVHDVVVADDAAATSWVMRLKRSRN